MGDFKEQKTALGYVVEIHARARFGGDNYLDGYSIYDSEKGYQHIVTFGFIAI